VYLKHIINRDNTPIKRGVWGEKKYKKAKKPLKFRGVQAAKCAF
jgi:hypothetical protein